MVKKMNPLEKCEQCPDFIMQDVQAYIQQLETENAKLQAQNAELVKKMEQLKEGSLITIGIREQDVKDAVKKAYECTEIDGKTLPEWIKLLADYKRHEWISAKEPPLEWKDADGNLINYLVYMPEYGVDVGNYMQTAETWVCMGLPCKVTYWMLLPEPPKEEQ